MIIGHGIDLQEIDAIKRAYEKNNRFAKRVLTDKEFQCFSEQKSTKRQMEFLAGRWAAKEAFSKAMGTGIGTLGFIKTFVSKNPYIILFILLDR